MFIATVEARGLPAGFQFDALQRYIAENPLRANLNPGEYLHFSNRAPR